MIYEAINKMNSLYEKSRRCHLSSQLSFGAGAAFLLLGVYVMPSLFLFFVVVAVLCCLSSIIFFAPDEKKSMNALRAEYKDTFIPGILNE